jgi:hypothetical protein
MLLQQLNRSDAEKVFIICRNTSGATIAANIPVYFETDAVTDGNAVSEMVTLGNFLLAGINDASIADDAYGLVQCYGYRTSAVVSAVVSSYSIVPGTPLVGVAGAAYLAYGSFLSTPVMTDYDNQVFSMETIASAAGKSATANARVFIKAM